jgi:tetratricopeptide (TPR) repeat protein/transcriptional regulator with XRE-family HTH domain
MSDTERAVTELGLALYRYRLARGLSLRGLAARLGMSGHGGLTEYEKGRRIPPEDIVLACERVLGITDGTLRDLRARALEERAASKAADRQGARLADPPVPLPVAQLPADPADFVGRVAETDRLTGPGALALAIISGKPGVGKTTLAVRVAHLLAAEHPDAQLYCDLRGVHAPADPADLLAGMIRALGAPDVPLPAGLAERAALYRSLLHDRRALVVLDNAADEQQVRPLLPGGPHCRTVVTSRSPLTGLAGGFRVGLDVPDTGTAVGLLSEIIGADRVVAEPAAAVELVTACGLLPLAVRIAGNRLAAWPDWTLTYLTGRLATERDRLAWLTAGDLEVRSAFALSYQALDGPGRRLFRRLSLVPGPDFGPDLATALVADPPAPTPPSGGAADAPAGTPSSGGPGEGELVLDELAAVGLVEPAPEAGRYRLHDLLRLYAAERLRDEEPEAAGVVEGLTDHLLASALRAALAVVPVGAEEPEVAGPAVEGPLADREAALAWLDAELANVLGAARRAGDQRVVELLRVLVWYFDLRCLWGELREFGELAQAAAADLPSAAMAWNCLGLAYNGMGEFAEAVRAHERAAELAASAGDGIEESSAYDKLGIALWGLGRFAEAAGHHRRDVEICRERGDTWGEAAGLNHLGYALRRQGLLAEAVECHRRAVDLMRDIGDTRSEAMGTCTLGAALAGLGRFEEARDCQERALAVFTVVGDEWAVGTARHGLGVALAGLDRPDAALEQLRLALAVFRAVRDRVWEARTLREQGRVLAATGELHEARSRWQQALDRFTELGSPEATEVRALLDPIH